MYQHTFSEMFAWEVKRKRKQKLKKNNQWTQTFVAAKAGITMRQIQNIESGTCDPHSTVSLAIAGILDIGMDKYRKCAIQERHSKAQDKLAR